MQQDPGQPGKAAESHMIEPIAAFFEKLIENFSWRRLSFLIALLALSILAIAIYEAYTSKLKLSRLEKQVSLVEKLATVSSASGTRSSPLLIEAAENLQRELLSTTRTAEVVPPPWGRKMLTASAAWLVFGTFLMLIPAAYSTTDGGRTWTAVAFGMVCVAAPFVALAAALPTFQETWVNDIAYPVGHIAVIVILIKLWQTRKRPF